MKLIPVNTVPAPKKQLQRFLDAFVMSHVAKVEIIFSPCEYRSARTCYSSFYIAARRSGHNIRVTIRDNHIFMENRSLGEMTVHYGTLASLLNSKQGGPDKCE